MSRFSFWRSSLGALICCQTIVTWQRSSKLTNTSPRHHIVFHSRGDKWWLMHWWKQHQLAWMARISAKFFHAGRCWCDLPFKVWMSTGVAIATLWFQKSAKFHPSLLTPQMVGWQALTGIIMSSNSAMMPTGPLCWGFGRRGVSQRLLSSISARSKYTRAVSTLLKIVVEKVGRDRSFGGEIEEIPRTRCRVRTCNSVHNPNTRRQCQVYHLQDEIHLRPVDQGRHASTPSGWVWRPLQKRIIGPCVPV